MICGKDLITKFLDEKNEFKESIKISLTEADAPPFDRNIQVGRDSIDLRIGRSGYKITCNYNFINTLDSNIDKFFSDFEIQNEGYLIEPGETLIVSTVEKIKLTGNITGELTGRTRFSRMGLSVCTATKFQSYSDAVAVLQLTNHNKIPLKIFPYQKLVQLVIHQVDGIPNERRGSYYNEGTLKKPIISDDELAGFSLEEKASIKRQMPKELPYTTIDGNEDVKKRINHNNRIMNIWSKIANAASGSIGLIIGIFCSYFTKRITLITVLCISSFLLTVLAVILDTIKDNNHIN